MGFPIIDLLDTSKVWTGWNNISTRKECVVRNAELAEMKRACFG